MRTSAGKLVGLLALVTLLVACDSSHPVDPGPPSNCDPGVLCENVTQNRTLHADTVYTISGFIQVTNGAQLTIQVGTRIEGDFDIPGSSLFITRGSRIVANGTAMNPIVFTSSRPVGQRRPGDWGGLILVGNGIINRGSPSIIEGTGTSEANPEQNYAGGTDNNDNSGTLRYVRVEFAGFPAAENQELNALTMAAVGSGTTIEFVQVLLGLDDSFEWFGGAVNARNLISYEAGDDHFDASEGYAGNVQYMIAFQSFQPEPRAGIAGGVASDPQGFENDGCAAGTCNGGNNNENAQPFTVPVFANFTLIGAPLGAWESSSGNIGMMLRRGVGGLYVNGVVARYSRAGISIRGDNTNQRRVDNLLAVRNVYLTEVTSTFQGGPAPGSGTGAQHSLDLGANAIEAGVAASLGLFMAVPANTVGATAANFDWRPAAGSPIATGGLNSFAGLSAALQAAAAGVVPTTYRGAAAPGGDQWWAGWTHYARN
ncbi:MAG: hypothetical protein WEG36_07985 [Gemmatimonadota bacterium]